MTYKSASEKTQALEALQQLQQYKGKKLLAIVNSVSRSGMSRRIEFYAPGKDYSGKDDIDRIGYYIARVIGERGAYDVDKGGLRVNGCGMDMVFHTLSNFNYAACQLENPELSWPELQAKFGRIYDTYFFDANNYRG